MTTEPTQKILSSTAVVRFSDCDPFNHLNNSKYIDYFLNAREDQLIAYYDFNLFEYTKQTGCGWVVSQHEIAYIKPAFTMEKVILESVLIRWGEKEIHVEFRMWDEKKTHIKSLMWTKFFHYNFTTRKSEAHSKEITERFKQVEMPVEETGSFEKRVDMLRMNNKKN